MLSDLFERKKACFPYEDYSTFNLNEIIEPQCLSEFRIGKRHSDAIAVFHINFISSILKIYDLPYRGGRNGLRYCGTGLFLVLCCGNFYFKVRYCTVLSPSGVQ